MENGGENDRSKFNLFESEVDEIEQSQISRIDLQNSHRMIDSRTQANFAEYSELHAHSERVMVNQAPFKYDKFIKKDNGKVEKVSDDHQI